MKIRVGTNSSHGFRQTPPMVLMPNVRNPDASDILVPDPAFSRQRTDNSEIIERLNQNMPWLAASS
jgi:hypothetical protein